MCGIVGQISSQATVSRNAMYQMSNRLLHRGPDESGIFVHPSRQWGLASRRLCVVDVACARQPMFGIPGPLDAAERNGKIIEPIVLAYNGEIYNYAKLRDELAQDGYPFQSRGDTEVVLALYARYGLEMLSHLRGEFAFALMDPNRHRLLLVRDRLGLKPLFYTQIKDSILFASEIKALFAHPQVTRKWEATGLLGSLALADMPGQTLFHGIYQVPPATSLIIDTNTLTWKARSYWQAACQAKTPVQLPFLEQVELVRQTLAEAVTLRLQADVPVGTYLSGGLDSSIVTALAAPQVDYLEAFTLDFPQSTRHQEFPFALAMTEKYRNIRLHRIPATEAQLIKLLPRTVWHLERPFGNLHSCAKLLAARYARRFVVCMLNGDGGDEVFCGYSTYWLQHQLQQADYQPQRIVRELRAMQREAWQLGGNRYYLRGGLARRRLHRYQPIRERIGFVPADLAIAWDVEQLLTSLFTEDFRRQVEISPTLRLADHLATKLPATSDRPDAERLQWIQCESLIPEYIAVLSDRLDSASSLENRPPFLDQQVVELGLCLPLTSKLSGTEEKYILKQAFGPILPERISQRRKQAFLAPPAPFRSPEGQYLLSQFMNRQAIEQAGIWQPWLVARLLQARALFPSQRLLNLLTTVILTTQLLHFQFIVQDGSQESVALN